MCVGVVLSYSMLTAVQLVFLPSLCSISLRLRSMDREEEGWGHPVSLTFLDGFLRSHKNGDSILGPRHCRVGFRLVLLGHGRDRVVLARAVGGANQALRTQELLVSVAPHVHAHGRVIRALGLGRRGQVGCAHVRKRADSVALLLAVLPVPLVAYQSTGTRRSPAEVGGGQFVALVTHA